MVMVVVVIVVVVTYIPKFPILEKDWWEISKLLKEFALGR